MPEQGKSFLKLSPSVVHLAPKESVRVEISFCPPVAEAPGRRQQQQQGKHLEQQGQETTTPPLVLTADQESHDAVGKGKAKYQSAEESGTKKKGEKKPAKSASRPAKSSPAAAAAAADEKKDQKGELGDEQEKTDAIATCLLYTSPSPRD